MRMDKCICSAILCNLNSGMLRMNIEFFQEIKFSMEEKFKTLEVDMASDMQ